MKQALCWSLAAGVALSLPVMQAAADPPAINFPSAGQGTQVAPPAPSPAPAAVAQAPTQAPVLSAPPVEERTEAPPVQTAPSAPPRPAMTAEQKAALDAATSWDRGVAGQTSTAPPVAPKPERLWPQVRDMWPQPPSDEVPVIDRPSVGAVVPSPPPPPTVLYGSSPPPEYPPAPPPGYDPYYGR
jgi:hypothetical protein